MAGREIRVPAYIIAVLGEERVAEEIKFVSNALQPSSSPPTIEKVLDWLDRVAEEKAELEAEVRALEAAPDDDFEAAERLHQLYLEAPWLDA